MLTKSFQDTLRSPTSWHRSIVICHLQESWNLRCLNAAHFTKNVGPRTTASPPLMLCMQTCSNQECKCSTLELKRFNLRRNCCKPTPFVFAIAVFGAIRMQTSLTWFWSPILEKCFFFKTTASSWNAFLVIEMHAWIVKSWREYMLVATLKKALGNETNSFYFQVWIKPKIPLSVEDKRILKVARRGIPTLEQWRTFQRLSNWCCSHCCVKWKWFLGVGNKTEHELVKSQQTPTT